MNLDTEDIYYGGSVHRAPHPQILQAGHLQCQYEAGYLRYIKAGDSELLRMIYPAVRDHNWGTVSPGISNEKVFQGKGEFEIHYDARYQEGEIDFQTHYHIKGDKEGNIHFEMQGKALSNFRKNRIGLNILHPPETAGAECVVGHTERENENGFFPKYISPHQPFKDMKNIRWKIDEIWAMVEFEGDIFEMEDQRNWTDASFKTYSTPLGIPFPVNVYKGETITQKVSLSVENKGINISGNEKLSITVGNERFQLPAIGIGQSTEVEYLSESDLKYLSEIHFSHYRVDLKLSQTDIKAQWERAIKEAKLLQLPLELALFFGEQIEEELKLFSAWIQADPPPIKQMLIFSSKHKSSPKILLDKVIPALKKQLPDLLIGAGTDCFFTELNRERVDITRLDFLTYSINPQVHQFDNQSLVETLQAQSYTVASAKKFANELPIHISPVTLKMRFNPNATAPEPEVSPGQLPPQVDTRQMSLFGAGWTVASLKYLSESELKSVTYYETLGRRGIMQGEHDLLLPDQFKVNKNMLYPMYWVFYWLLQSENAQFIRVSNSDPLQLEGMVWENNGKRMMLLVNLQPAILEVDIKGWKNTFEQKLMDENHYQLMTHKPEAFVNSPWQETQNPIKLKPYALGIFR